MPARQPNLIMGAWGASLGGVIFGGGTWLAAESAVISIPALVLGAVVGFEIGKRF